MNKTYKSIPARMKAEAFKQRVMSCFRAWEVNWTIAPNCSDMESIFRTGHSTRWIS